MTKWTGTSEAAKIGFEKALGADRRGVTIGALFELTMDDLSQAMMDARVIDGNVGHYRTILADQLPLGGGVAPQYPTAAPAPEAAAPVQREGKTSTLIDQAAEMDVTLMSDQEVR
eukprot:1343548-Amphidinium_carterae.1